MSLPLLCPGTQLPTHAHHTLGSEPATDIHGVKGLGTHCHRYHHPSTPRSKHHELARHSNRNAHLCSQEYTETPDIYFWFQLLLGSSSFKSWKLWAPLLALQSLRQIPPSPTLPGSSPHLDTSKSSSKPSLTTPLPGLLAGLFTLISC